MSRVEEGWIDYLEDFQNGTPFLDSILGMLDPDERVLGLDISVSSTGICIASKAGIQVGNIHMPKYKDDVFALAKRRLYFKEALLGVLEEGLGGEEPPSFAAVVVEDVFGGVNQNTVRELYNLNTVIDELIVEGSVETEDFSRIQNSVWKSWIRDQIYDDDGMVHDRGKHLSDKLVVQEAEKVWGITPESIGGGKYFQDRMDATGMAVGYVKEYGVSPMEGWVEEAVEDAKGLGILSEEDLKKERDFKGILHIDFNGSGGKGFGKGLEELHLSRIDLRNKINQGYKALDSWLKEYREGKLVIIKDCSLGLYAEKYSLPLSYESGVLRFYTE